MTPPAVEYGTLTPTTSLRSLDDDDCCCNLSTSPTSSTPPPPSSPSSSSLLSRIHHRTRRRANMSPRVRHFLTPRVLAPVLLWSISLWLVHRYLIALPIPKWKAAAPTTTQVSMEVVFPPPPEREGEDWLDSVDTRYRPFSPIQPHTPFPRLRPTRFLPTPCLESWFLDGAMVCSPEHMGKEDQLDATWLWVNGSDNRWADEMKHWREIHDVESHAKHFREQDELKYSMRSVVTALEGHIRTCHLVLYDFAFNLTRDLDILPQSTVDGLEGTMRHHRAARSTAESFRDENGTESGVSEGLAQRLSSHWRVVQTPTWLDFSKLDSASPDRPAGNESSFDSDEDEDKPARPNFRYAAHSEIFHLPTKEGADIAHIGEAEWKEAEWRKKALPTYNSMAIESRLGWLPGLGDVSLALNDDFFMLRPHSVSDFHSLLYGNVFRFDWSYYHQVRPTLDATKFGDAAETGGLNHANYLLSQRFSHRLRPYFAHTPKVITRSLHHEASLMFQDAITLSASRRFREVTWGEGDVQMQWLLTSLRVERWREALLWTWVVANLGGVDGRWNSDTRDEIKELFGLGAGDDDVALIEVHRGSRKMLPSMNENLKKAGLSIPKATQFIWTSMDGHIPRIPKPGTDAKETNKCLLDLEQCFGDFWTGEDMSANDMFKRISFAYPRCGDCMIMALVTASGEKGLSAFFPPGEATFVTPSTNPYPHFIPTPHLPLTPTWQEADFTLDNVLSTTTLPGEEVNLREYTMHLLSRYQYSHGKSVSHFHMLKDPAHAHKVFDEMLDKNRKVSILGLNDDIERQYDTVRGIMHDWFESRWPDKLVWERE